MVLQMLLTILHSDTLIRIHSSDQVLSTLLSHVIFPVWKFYYPIVHIRKLELRNINNLSTFTELIRGRGWIQISVPDSQPVLLMLEELRSAAKRVMCLYKEGENQTKKEMGYKGRGKPYLNIRIALGGERLQQKRDDLELRDKMLNDFILTGII